MLYSLSNLDAEKLKAIQSLEGEIGSPLIALSGIRVDDAKLPDDRLRKLQDLEQKLGVVLVAVK